MSVSVLKAPLEGVEIIHPALDTAQRMTLTLQTGVDPYTRRLYLLGEIDDDTLHHFIPAFQILDSTEGAINIVLASPGGSEAVGWAVYDTIKLARNPVIIDGYGGVYSIAASIMQAGGYRRLAPNCRFMIHNGTVTMGSEVGTNEFVNMGQEAEKNNQKYHRILAERSGRTTEEIADFCRNESFFSAQEAIAKGFADGLVPHPNASTWTVTVTTTKKKGRKK
jgi:ATP-dependent protease ClpP protease subunit